VVASSGRKAELEGFLKKLGAKEVIDRLGPGKPLNKETYAAAVDTVGGVTLASALASMMYGRAVATCGLAGDSALQTTVMPFILRAVKLLGVDSVQAPMEERTAVWEALATSLPRALLSDLASEHSLEDVVGELGANILQGKVKGRAVVRLSDPAPSSKL